MKFFKYEGTGNDFLILETSVAPSKAVIQQICDRRFGIGADGILFSSASSQATIMMNYYNADGSVAAMCGNGLRCFVQYLRDQEIVTEQQYTVETLAGLIDVRVEGALIELNLGPATVHEQTQVEGLTVTPVTLATEHAVVFATSKEDRKIKGPNITENPLFPRGVNTSFVDVINDRLYVETHERGSGWTLSCGTGVAASATVAIQKGLVSSPVTVLVPGGELSVRVDQGVYLKGPATYIAKGEWK